MEDSPGITGEGIRKGGGFPSIFHHYTSVRQGRDEDVASYTERVLILGKNAYGDKGEQDDTVKAQALAVYMEGF